MRIDWVRSMETEISSELIYRLYNEKFCEIPYKAAVENQADMVIFEYDVIKGKKQNKKNLGITGFIDREIAIDIGGATAWNRLYKRILFNDCIFPEGRFYEDIAITYKIVYNASRIISIQRILYHKYNRLGSISRSSSYIKNNDFFDMSIRRYDDLISYGYPQDKLKNQLLFAALRCCANSEVLNKSLNLQMAAFSGQQGRNTRPVRAIIGGQQAA